MIMATINISSITYGEFIIWWSTQYLISEVGYSEESGSDVYNFIMFYIRQSHLLLFNMFKFMSILYTLYSNKCKLII